MGVVHKLRSEVRDFIIEQKKLKPSLSCRAFTLLIAEKLKVKVSKSSINDIFKENNLSMPVGRRQNIKKKKFNMPVLPIIESVKAIAVDAEPKKLVLKEEAKVEKVIKEEVVVEQEKIDSGDERIKEAENWAMKLLEEERNRSEQEKLAREAAQKKAEEEKIAREKVEIELKEKEILRKIEEEKIKAEKEKLDREAAQKKIEEEKLVKEKAEVEIKEKEVLRKIEEVKAKDEQEKLAREAELKAERERWARLAEEENKRKEALKASQVVKEQGQNKEESSRLFAEDVRRQEGEKIEQEEISGTVKEPAISKNNEFVSVGALPQTRGSSGMLLLKAIDYLIGGSSQINAVLCKKINCDSKQTLALTEALIFKSLFEKNKDFSDLWNFVGRQYTQEILQNYSKQIQQDSTIKLDILHVISKIFTEAKGVKINFSNGDVIYLDGQLHTTWSTANSPNDFSDTVYGLKNYLNRYFFEAEPLVLFTAPGYDIPPKEFFTLLFNFSDPSKSPDVLTLYGKKLEDLESISLHQQKSYSVVFCLWPWQYTSQRKVKKLGDFELRRIESVNRDLYLAEIEIDLLQPALGKSITLKGCAVKTSLDEKIRLAIFSNMPIESLDKLAGLYLSHWPNLEESFQDFSRKIELSTYAGNVQKFAFLSDSVKSSEPAEELDEIFANYIKMLDAYLRWYFLPSGYQQKDFVFTSDNFYKLPAMFVASKSKVSVKIQAGANYLYLKDLEYLIRRFNERQIDLGVGQLFCLENISGV
jgi:hypothetical protein